LSFIANSTLQMKYGNIRNESPVPYPESKLLIVHGSPSSLVAPVSANSSPIRENL